MGCVATCAAHVQVMTQHLCLLCLRKSLQVCSRKAQALREFCIVTAGFPCCRKASVKRACKDGARRQLCVLSGFQQPHLPPAGNATALPRSRHNIAGVTTGCRSKHSISKQARIRSCHAAPVALKPLAAHTPPSTFFHAPSGMRSGASGIWNDSAPVDTLACTRTVCRAVQAGRLASRGNVRAGMLCCAGACLLHKAGHLSDK